MPKFSITTLTTGASALVVQLARLMILCLSGSNVSRLIRQRSSIAVFALLARRADRYALGAGVEMGLGAGTRGRSPLQSITGSTPRAFQFGSAFIESKYGISRPPMTKQLSFAVTSSGQRPSLESISKSSANVGTSLMSEMDTGTNNLSLSATLIKDRPMRPKPCIAILGMTSSFHASASASATICLASATIAFR